MTKSTLPNFTTQSGSEYKANIDGSIAVLDSSSILNVLKSSFTFDFETGALTWATVGNAFGLTSYAAASVTALNSTDIAFVDGTNDELKTYRFDGTDWVQIGNSLPIANLNGPGIAALNETDIAFIDNFNDDLRTYRFDGTDWVQIGNDLPISGVGSLAIAALNETDIVFIDSSNDDLRTYRFDGTDWGQVGNDLNISGVSFPSGLAALNSTDVAFCTSGKNTIQAYRFDGTNWATLGSALSVTTNAPALSALNGTDIAFYDTSGTVLRVYRFNGSTWSQVGSTFTATGSGTSVLTAFTGRKIAFTGNTPDTLQTYEFDFDESGIEDVSANGKLDPLVYSGATINVSGTVSNDGAYTVSSIADTDNIKVSETVTNEVAVTSTISIQINDGDQVVGDTSELVVRP